MSLDLHRQRIVLFGGTTPRTGAPGDTWEFDGVGWSLRSTPLSPPPSASCALAYDPQRQLTVLFGLFGNSSGTWEWDGNSWLPRGLGVQPTARRATAMVSDLGRGKIVLYGGRDATTGVSLGDTWTFDGLWVQLAANSTMPARWGHAMAYDVGRQQVLAFGGLASSTLTDTWRLGPTGQWTQVTTAHMPAARARPVLAYDFTTNRTLLECLEMRPDGVEVPATWFFDGIDWTRDAGASQPPQRTGHALVPDALSGGMLLFGGRAGAATLLADCWRWDGGRWIDRTPAVTPSPRWMFQIATDRARSRVVLFGGQDANGALGDTWEWNGQSWTRMPPGPQDPAPRFGGAMAYDAARSVCVQFGGMDLISSVFGETRTWNGTSWHFVTNVGPPPTVDLAMTYDAARGQVLAFGGFAGPVPQSDVWRWNGSAWSRAFPAVAPNPRHMQAMAYDPRRQRALVHGGVDPALNGDTWEWNGTQWTQTWLARLPDLLPLGGGPNSMAYDERRGCMLLHDGVELWTYTTQPGTSSAYGVGCGAAAPLTLRAPNRPFLGNEGFHLLLSGAPIRQPFAVFLGFQPDNTVLGAGCTAWLVPAQVWLTGVTDSVATLAHSPLPGDPALFGLTGGLQAAVLDPSAPLGFTVSNGLALVLGF